VTTTIDCSLNNERKFDSKKIIQIGLIAIGWVVVFMIFRKIDIVRMLPSL
jgi:hypothetical protein